MPSLLDTVDFGRPAWFLPTLTVGILTVAGIVLGIKIKTFFTDNLLICYFLFL